MAKVIFIILLCLQFVCAERRQSMIDELALLKHNKSTLDRMLSNLNKPKVVRGQLADIENSYQAVDEVEYGYQVTVIEQLIGQLYTFQLYEQLINMVVPKSKSLHYVTGVWISELYINDTGTPVPFDSDLIVGDSLLYNAFATIAYRVSGTTISGLDNFSRRIKRDSYLAFILENAKYYRSYGSSVECELCFRDSLDEFVLDDSVFLSHVSFVADLPPEDQYRFFFPCRDSSDGENFTPEMTVNMRLFVYSEIRSIVNNIKKEICSEEELLRKMAFICNDKLLNYLELLADYNECSGHVFEKAIDKLLSDIIEIRKR